MRRLHLPVVWARWLMSRLIRLGVGDQRRFGLERPEHPMWREHATLSQEFLPCIGHGYIDVKPNVTWLDGTRIQFADRTEAPYDAIIYATGYHIAFPFLDRSLFDPDSQAAELYRRMIPPAHPGLIFAGLVQPVGPTIPLVEIQGKWIAAVLSGQVALPDAAGMRQEISEHLEHKRRTYLDSARYTLEVDFRRYAKQMHMDMDMDMDMTG